MTPLCCKKYIYYTKHESTEQFLLQIKIIVSELLFLMTEIIGLQLYHLYPTHPYLWPWKWSSKR